MPPKNPVRAARQAGRQQIRAAKDARKVAKIENRVAGKVAKISGTPAAKPVAKTSTYKPSAPTVKLPATPKPTIKMTDTRSKMLDMPVSTRKATSTPTKKKVNQTEQTIIKMWKDKGYTYGKDGKVRNAQGQTPEQVEELARIRSEADKKKAEAAEKTAQKRKNIELIQKIGRIGYKKGGSVKRKK